MRDIQQKPPKNFKKFLGRMNMTTRGERTKDPTLEVLPEGLITSGCGCAIELVTDEPAVETREKYYGRKGPNLRHRTRPPIGGLEPATTKD